MSTDRWDRIQQLYHAALELQPSQRAGFLAQACPNDPELRREVESLLAYEGQADGLLENPEWKTVGAGETTTPAPPAMAAGAQLGVFRIVEFLGAGGMGEVYRATDTRLHRDVAIKMLSAEYAPQPQWLSRFQREARAVAALNHPNICTLHDVGPNYLVMELIEGPTLAERMAKGALPLKEALDIVRQIAEALEAAHEKGIVHRDLKPANIKLTAEGTVKVLDFGLAKAQEPAAGSAEHSPTLTATGAGMILGTAAYMSPEQAIGKPVDKRADIWSFGVVLWEMLAGRRLFQGETVSHILANKKLLRSLTDGRNSCQTLASNQHAVKPIGGKRYSAVKHDSPDFKFHFLGDGLIGYVIYYRVLIRVNSFFHVGWDRHLAPDRHRVGRRPIILLFAEVEEIRIVQKNLAVRP